MTLEQNQILISGVNQARSQGINDSVEILRYLTKTEVTGYNVEYVTGSKYPNPELSQMEQTYVGILGLYGLNVGVGVGETIKTLQTLYAGNLASGNISAALTINAHSQILSNTYFYFSKLGVALNGTGYVVTENKTALYSLSIVDFEINVNEIEGI